MKALGLAGRNIKIVSISKKALKNRSRGGRQKELASMLSQEILSPLTILSMNNSRILLKCRNNPDLRVSEVLPLLEKIEQNVLRIKDATQAIAGRLHKSME